MTEIKLSFEVTATGDPELARSAIEDRLAVVPDIDDVGINVVKVGSGFADPITLIAAAIVMTKGGTQLVGALRELVSEIRGLRADINGVGAVRAEVDGRQIPIEQLDPEQWAADVTGAT